MPVGSQNFDYKIGKPFFVNMENNDVRNADIDVALTVEHRNDFYDLNFHVTGEVTVACDRCLDDLQIPIDNTYHTVVKYGDDYEDNDEYMVIPESDNYLNVAYMIYDTAVLAIPPRHVHPQGKCNRAMSALNKKYLVKDAEEDADDIDSDLLIDDSAAED